MKIKFLEVERVFFLGMSTGWVRLGLDLNSNPA